MDGHVDKNLGMFYILTVVPLDKYLFMLDFYVNIF